MGYKFTQPIRYYKANDPYYYEVDNIPLRQLEENILHLKDYLRGASQGSILTSESELDLRNIKQLRPTIEGYNSRTIKVNAGWFSARINDAYDVAPILSKFLLREDALREGGGPAIIPDLENVWTDTLRTNVWDAFTTDTTATDRAFNMNGLEVAYTFHSTPGGLGGNWGVTLPTKLNSEEGNYPYYDKTDPGQDKKWPLQTHSKLCPWDMGGTITASPFCDVTLLCYNYKSLQDVHLAFVKMWRSPFRTAVVDFPEQTIEVPAWDEDDFWYYDSDPKSPTAGINRIDSATQRIDLLVAYAVPIDASGATLGNYASNFTNVGTVTPKKIFSPQLGIVRGAGVGIRDDSHRHDNETIPTQFFGVTTPQPGEPKILANTNDATAGASTGLKNAKGVVINGSFPSPDDLVNMAPILATEKENLTNTEKFQLIGQTALPLAYIVVNENKAVLSNDDILDIRPFMRTAELTYNERAGVAAANPALSLANPAVGAYQLQDTVNTLRMDPTLRNTGAGAQRNGSVIYADIVQGGLAYGVEGTLLSMVEDGALTTASTESPWQLARETTSYKASDGENYAKNGLWQWQTSQGFLADANINAKKAFIEFLFRHHQSKLKKWLKDPFLGSTKNIAGSYQGMPDRVRSIALLPEWDIPMTPTNNPLEETKTPNEVTWWMWLEGTSEVRPYIYAPGAAPFARTTPNGPNKAQAWPVRLNGYMGGATKHEPSHNYNLFTATCSKTFNLRLPSWCTDYDVIVDYVNCLPINNNEGGATTAGLNIWKGPVVTNLGQQEARFTINSTANPLPADDESSNRRGGSGNNAHGMITGDGRVLDLDCDDTGADQNCDGFGSSFQNQWLSYSVIGPQFTRKGNLSSQITGTAKWPNSLGARNASTKPSRFMPKLGASFYPTVSFKIIAYTANPMDNGLVQESTVSQTGVWVPLNASYGDTTSMFSEGAGARLKPPIYDGRTSVWLDVTKA